MKNTRIPCYLLFSFLLLWPMRAAAVVPTVDELLTSITARRIYIQSFEAVYEFTESASQNSETGSSGYELPVQETIYYSAPDRIRLNLTWRDKEEVFLAVGSKTLALAVDETEKAAWPQPFLLFRLLVDSDVVRLRQLLITSRVNLQKIALERHHGRIVYVLGTRSGGRGRAQVWFDRETLRLTRLIIRPDQNSPVYDLELTDYRFHEKKIDWPGTLITKKDNGPAEILRLKTLTIDPKLEFDSLDQDKKEPDESSVPPDPEEILASDPEIVKIRKMFESFRKKLE